MAWALRSTSGSPRRITVPTGFGIEEAFTTRTYEIGCYLSSTTADRYLFREGAQTNGIFMQTGQNGWIYFGAYSGTNGWWGPGPNGPSQSGYPLNARAPVAAANHYWFTCILDGRVPPPLNPTTQGKVSLYRDGSLFEAVSGAGDMAGIHGALCLTDQSLDSMRNYYGGLFAGGTSYPWWGWIYMFRIWNRVLTPQEISYNVWRDIPTPAPGCILNYRMQEGTGTTINDFSGQNIHGTRSTSLEWLQSNPPARTFYYGPANSAGRAGKRISP